MSKGKYDVVRWEDETSWRPIVDHFLLRNAKGDTRRKAVELRKKKLDVDAHAWKDALEEVLELPLDKAVTLFAESLTKRKVLAFHGCRPLDIASYLKHGIRFSRPEQRIEQLEAVMDKLALNKARRADTTQSFQLLDSKELDRPIIYLLVDRREFQVGCGHYVLRGSEWLDNPALLLSSAQLEELGTGTIFEVALPIRTLQDGCRLGLAEDLLIEGFRLRTLPGEEVRVLGSTIFYAKSITPLQIVTHTHIQGRLGCQGQIMGARTDGACPQCAGPRHLD